MKYRGAEIRTRDLTDPNGARYQAAPRPDASRVFHTTAIVALVSVDVGEILAELDACWSQPASRTTAPTGCRFPARRGDDSRDGRVCACRAVRARRRRGAPTCLSFTTDCSGARARARSTRRSSDACGSCSMRTSASRPTTCRSMPTQSSATMRCSPALLGQPSSSRSRFIVARQSASSRASPARVSPPPRSSPRPPDHGAGAARLRLRAGSGAPHRDRVGSRGRPPDRGSRSGS